MREACVDPALAHPVWHPGIVPPCIVVPADLGLDSWTPHKPILPGSHTNRFSLGPLVSSFVSASFLSPRHSMACTALASLPLLGYQTSP